MRNRFVAAAAVVFLLGLLAWKLELIPVSPPGEPPRPLALVERRVPPERRLDVLLPAIPVGGERLRAGDGVILLHYWAPWERHGLAQARLLDSLGHQPGLDDVRMVVVCLDPFPSVARYLGRNRLRLRVVLDGGRVLRRALPCPRMPYTYVVDRSGRIAVAQPGEVDWLSPATRRTLEGLSAEVDSSEREGPAPPETGI